MDVRFGKLKRLLNFPTDLKVCFEYLEFVDFFSSSMSEDTVMCPITSIKKIKYKFISSRSIYAFVVQSSLPTCDSQQ